MGRRDDNRLTPDADEAAERALRALLARSNEPTPIPPPPDLAARIVRRLPIVPPAQAAEAARRRVARGRAVVWGVALLLLTLSALGAWGILVNSNGPALLLGGPQTALGYAALVVTLAAKPLIGLLLSAGAPTLLGGALLLLAAALLWWRLASRPGPSLVTERP